VLLNRTGFNADPDPRFGDDQKFNNFKAERIMKKLQFISSPGHHISSFFQFLRDIFVLLDPDPAGQNQCGFGSTMLNTGI
jgi:hypothetical protein